MRGLTLKRPWDYAIAELGKRVENRGTKPHRTVIGTRIALHAGKDFDYDGLQWMRTSGRYIASEPMLPTKPGMIFATALLAGWVSNHPNACVLTGGKPVATARELLELVDDPWFFGPYGWALQDLVKLPRAVQCRGMQGLWPVPADIETEVLRQESAGRKAA